jgi:hypothetical protein
MITSNKQMHDELRARVTELLATPIPDETWDYLVSEGKADAVQHGQKNLDWLADEILRLDKAAGGKLLFGREDRPTLAMIERRRGDIVQNREEALSILLAKEARLDPSVQLFRSQVLKDHCLSPQEVDGWVLRQVDRDSGPWHILHRIPYEGSFELTDQGVVRLSPPLRLTTLPTGARTERRLLSYGMPGDEHARHIIVRVGGVLDRLSQLADALAERFGWGKAESTLFILTDRIPWFRSIKGSLRFTGNMQEIVLTIDPAVNPAEVAAKYKLLRNRLTKGQRIRALSKKHMTLATFMADRPDESWSSRMAGWNKTHKSWRYRGEGNFRRDAAQAIKRFRRLRNAPESWAAVFGILVEGEKLGRIRPRKAKK